MSDTSALLPATAACPQCHTVNRTGAGVPRDAHCGRCGHALFDGQPAAVDFVGGREVARESGVQDLPLVIDVRSEREFAARALQGAINVPLPALVARIGEIAPQRDTEIALYCASGGRSEMACAMLHALGYVRVVNAGGLFAASATLGMPLR